MAHRKYRFAFLVQAEGRGHMTQAISLYKLLTSNGHEVCCAFIGKSKRRKIPDFFSNQIKSPLYEIESPNFITDEDNRSIKIYNTLAYNIRFIGKYLNSLNFINRKIKEFKPDALINFYEILGGFYFRIYNTKTKHICIGHQFLAEHPEFPFAPNKEMDKRLFRSNNHLTSIKAHKKLALSFRPYATLQHKNMVVMPPLIREEIKNLKPEDKKFILGYMVNDGYGDDIIKWHKNNREIEVHCFWDRKGYPDEYRPHENIFFHQLSGEKFIEKMRTCSGFVSTAGFESVCEAMYLGKPVLMIPVEGQYEQACNAIDAENAGAGIQHHEFDIQKLIEYIPDHQPVTEKFKDWVNEGDDRFLKELTNL